MHRGDPGARRRGEARLAHVGGQRSGRSGEPAINHWRRSHERCQSSHGIVRRFCGQCGTSLTYQRELEPDTIDVTTASLDRADDFAPTREIWIGEKLAWESLNGAARTFPGSSRLRLER